MKHFINILFLFCIWGGVNAQSSATVAKQIDLIAAFGSKTGVLSLSPSHSLYNCIIFHLPASTYHRYRWLFRSIAMGFIPIAMEQTTPDVANNI